VRLRSVPGLRRIRASALEKFGIRSYHAKEAVGLNLRLPKEITMPDQPVEKPGPHHPHEGHIPGDLDPHGHRDQSATPQRATPKGVTEQPGAHHPHEGHKPGDLDPHGHRDTSGEQKK
jgi:hypothetical protein